MCSKRDAKKITLGVLRPVLFAPLLLFLLATGCFVLVVPLPLAGVTPAKAATYHIGDHVKNLANMINIRFRY